MLCGIEYTDPNMHPRLPSSCCARPQSKHKVAEANGTCCKAAVKTHSRWRKQTECVAMGQQHLLWHKAARRGA